MLEKAPHYDSSSMAQSWGEEPDKRVAAKYDLTRHRAEMRASTTPWSPGSH